MSGKFTLTAVFETIDKITAPVKNITNSITTLSNKVKAANTALSNTAKKASRKFYDLRNSVVDYASGLKEGESYSTKFSNAAKDLNTTQKNFKQILRDNGIELRGMGKHLEQVSIKAFDLGRKLSLLVTLPVLAFTRSTVKTVADFQLSMNKVAAKTEASIPQMVDLNKKARQLGATTQFTAAEVAEGMAKLAESNFKYKEITEALPKVLELAAAGQLTMAESADIATSAIAGFRLKVEDVGNVADMLTNAANSAKTNVSEMGRAFSYTARTAANAGFSMSETLAILGQFSAASVRSGRAGRAFVGMLSSIQKLNPREGFFGAVSNIFGLQLRDPLTGNLKKAREIFNEFSKIQKAVGVEKASAILFKLFGKQVAPVLSLLSGDKMVEAVKNIERSGTAAKNTALLMQGLPGILKLLNSAFQELQITIFEGPFGDGISYILTNVTALFRLLSEKYAIVTSMASAFALFAAALGPLLIILGTLGTAFKIVLGTPALLAVFSFTAALGTALIVIGSMVLYWDKLSSVMKVVFGIGTALLLIFAPLPTLIAAGLVGVAKILPKINKELEKGTSLKDIYLKGIGYIGEHITKLVIKLMGIMPTDADISKLFSNIFNSLKSWVDPIFAYIGSIFTRIFSTIKRNFEDARRLLVEFREDLKNLTNSILRPLGLAPFTPTIGGIPQQRSPLPNATTLGGSANITVKVESEEGTRAKVSSISNTLTGTTISIDSGFMGKPVGAF